MLNISHFDICQKKCSPSRVSKNISGLARDYERNEIYYTYSVSLYENEKKTKNVSHFFSFFEPVKHV